MKLPLKDGDEFQHPDEQPQIVEGEIADVGTESVCWTSRGNWFRRSDGVQVTGAYRDENNNPVTIQEYYRIKNNRTQPTVKDSLTVHNIGG